MTGLLVLVLLAPARAGADLSFVQTVQSQTSAGADGLFGKTWVEVSGRRMRLVSGFARKLPKGGSAGPAEPLRLIQVLDLDTTSLLLIDPSSRTFESRSLTDVGYAHFLRRRLARGAPVFSVSDSSVTVGGGTFKRRCGDVACDHYHVTARLRLSGPDGPPLEARMEQDLWVAPVQGEKQKGLLDLMVFESEYRRLTGLSLSPLDYETYQMSEAAAYLRVPEGELSRVVEAVKRATVEIPGYPLSSSVSWWRQGDEPVAKKKGKPKEIESPPRPQEPLFVQAPAPDGPKMPPQSRRLVPLRPVYSVNSRFQLIDWKKMSEAMDRAYERDRRRWGERPARQQRDGYERFHEELKRVVAIVPPAVVGPSGPTVGTAGSGKAPAAAPFYEVFADIGDLSFLKGLPASHFTPPPGYTRK